MNAAAEKRVPATARRAAHARAAFGPVGRLENFIPYKLAVVANRLSQSIGQLFASEFDIQMPEWRILMTLHAGGSLVFTEVVDRTSMDKARVSRAQKRLADVGLIATASDPGDRRKLILALTARGRRMCADILPRATEHELWFLQELTRVERRQLNLILDKLMRRGRGLSRRHHAR
ncbi:MAG: winged helix-turn-helix transcriptional regulator [Gammaproteobacteria bacterium]|nr:winged helix-turn-helix transcriptional regulator [Gammaproteobacteria bacterium]